MDKLRGFIMGIIFIGVLGFIFLMVVAKPDMSGVDDFFKNLLYGNQLQEENIELSSSQGLTSLHLLISSDVDVESVDIKLELFDDSGVIIKSETKTFTNLSANETYNFQYSMSLADILSAKTYRFVFVQGKKA